MMRYHVIEGYAYDVIHDVTKKNIIEGHGRKPRPQRTVTHATQVVVDPEWVAKSCH